MSRPNPASGPAAATAAGTNPLRTGALVLLGLASVLAAWLVYASLQTGPVPGCDGGDCGIVLTSKWAKVFGIPVGAFGLVGYVVLAWLASRPFTAARRSQQRIAATLVVLIPAVALWFVALQAFVLHAFCPWCCATHAVATVGAVLTALAWRKDAALSVAPPAATSTAPRKAARAASPAAAAPVAVAWMPSAFGALAVLAGFVALQAVSPEPPKPKARAVSLASATPATNRPTSAAPAAPTPSPTAVATNAASPTSPATPTTAAASTTNPPSPARAPGQIVLYDGRFTIDAREYPTYGSPTAQHLLVMVSDYTCPHCRHAVKFLDEVREAFDATKLGILMLPSHHGGDSLEIQRMMLAAWRLDPGAWAEISHDIYLEKTAARPDAVRALLNPRFGVSRLDSAIAANSEWTERLFALAREVHATNKVKAGSGSIPQLLAGTELLVGAPADAGEIFGLLDRGFGLVRDQLPDLAFPSDSFQVGRVFAGTTTQIRIPFTNTGKANLQIGKVALPTGSRVLKGLQTPTPPGQTSAVEVALLVPRDPGPFEQKVTLMSNARPSDRPVTIRGTVWKPIRITPTILDLGRFDADLVSTQGVLRVELDEEAVLESVRSQNPGFRAELKTITPGRSYEIHVATEPDITIGEQRTALVVPVRKPVPPGWPENFAFAARAIVDRPVVTLPQRLYLAPETLTTDRFQQVLVRCYDGFPGFAVTGASLEGGPPLVSPEVVPTARTNEVVVKFTLPAGWTPPKPPLEGRVVLQTNHPRRPTLEVPFAVQEPK